MPIFFFLVGLMLLVSGIKGTTKDLVDVVKDDFTGDNNFIFWVAAMAFLVAVGQIKAIRPLTQGFLWLVIIVLIVQSEGLLEKFTRQVKLGISGE